MNQVIQVRDNQARMRAASYLALPGLALFSIVFTVPLLLLYLPKYGLENLATDIPTLAVLIATFLAELATVVVALWYVGELRNWIAMLRLRLPIGKIFFLGPLMGLLYFGGLELITVIFKIAGITVSDSDTSATFAHLPGVQKFVVLFLCVSLLAPMVEEIVFRGYILGFLLKGNDVDNGVLRKRRVIWAIAYSSLLFSLLHYQGLSSPIDFVVLVWTFLFGCGSSILRIRTQSLYPSMGAHATYNFCSALALFLM